MLTDRSAQNFCDFCCVMGKHVYYNTCCHSGYAAGSMLLKCLNSLPIKVFPGDSTTCIKCWVIKNIFVSQSEHQTSFLRADGKSTNPHQS